MTTDIQIRERILIGGAAGASKTYSFLKIVDHLPDGHHIAIDVDDGMSKLLAFEFPQVKATIYDLDDKGSWIPRDSFKKGSQLSVYHCKTFKAVRLAQAEIEKMVAGKGITYGDWLCIDGLDLIYSSMRFEIVQKALSRRNGTEDAWDVAVEARGGKAPTMEGGDWDMVHSFLESFLTYCAFQIPCNLYVTTGIAAINENSPYVDDDTRVFYSSLGVNLKFEGYKRAPRLFDTLLAAKHDPTGYYVHIWKDRGGLGRKWKQAGSRHRPDMNYVNNDFWSDIGCSLLGWESPEA